MKRIVVLSLALVVGTAQAQQARNQDEVRFRVVATTTQASDLLLTVTEGVEGLQITSLMSAGVDPHLYQPTESDIRAIREADMLVHNGLGLEAQFSAVFRGLSEQGVRVYALSDPVKQAGFVMREYDERSGSFGPEDPHFWFDPRNWELSVVGLAEALSELDADYAQRYRANAQAYVEQLQALFVWASEAMSSVPEAQRTLVTSHDAFRYFGAAFGWRVAAVQGISTRDEAGVGDVQAIVDLVASQDIPVLFIESSVAPNTIRAVVEAAASRGTMVRLGLRELYSDAMGQRDSFGGSYVGMLTENILTILQSYACAGVTLAIPDWPTILPTLPEELINVDCAI
ncbi:MAG: zinc ABC transporter substrate-binding protein [Anaerolineae bacterium]|nr:zinc ABC transporter substrate-binding protein [Anaerolineae bacterium]MDW8173241.1 zinc ABC transporter substrate-binding protein [Anaerolineae bacterium]